MPNCWNCGKDGAEKREYFEYGDEFGDSIIACDVVQRCYCKECSNVVASQYKKDLQDYIRLKKKMMFERAVRIMERQRLDIYDYQEAIKAVEEFAREKPDKFDSSYEMIAAIVLINNEIKCELQYKVGKYQCDFCIPSMKVILEIDGDRHKYKKKYDSVRDTEIIATLGRGWNIVRIKTEYLDQKAELLVEAIKAVVEDRKRRQINQKAFRTMYK